MLLFRKRVYLQHEVCLLPAISGFIMLKSVIRMISVHTFEHLSGCVSASMEAEYASWRKSGGKSAKSLFGYGRFDKVRSQPKENVLMTLVRDAVCYADKKLFLASRDGQSMFVYNGRHFEAVSGILPCKFLKELVKRVFRRLDVGICYQSKTAEDIARECVDTVMSSDEYLYEPDKRYIAFSNGIFDLNGGRLKPFDIKYRPYISLDIDYKDSRQCNMDNREACRLWERKLADKEEGIIPNSEMRDAFQQFCGSLLVDRDAVKIEYVCYLIGPGSNGKSVLASAISGVFGEEYFSRFTPRQLFKDSDARVNMAALQGKIANLVGDLDEKDMSGGDFKRFASGERFQGRMNYKEPILVQAPPLLCCTNSMPETADDSWGHHRRQLPIYTTRRQWTEEDKDPMLAQKLTTAEARQYIFNWIYSGYRKIMRNGGTISLGEEVIEAQRELQSDSNSMRRWFRDEGYVAVPRPPENSDPRWRKLKEWYDDYVRYASENGYTKPCKRPEVTAMLRSLGCVEQRRSDGYWFCIGRRGIDTTEKGGLITKKQ